MDKDIYSDTYCRVQWQPLQAFVAQVFAGLGMPEVDAAMEAEVLVWANLRGIDSHGVQRVEEYARRVDEGIMNPQPSTQREKEPAAVVRDEAEFAFGPAATTSAMGEIIANAREGGIVWGQLSNTSPPEATAP